MPEGIQKLNDMSTHEELTKQRTPEEQKERDALIESLKEQNKKETGHESWYEWCVTNWDTKWSAYDCWTLEDDFNKIEDFTNIGFQTAWSPPINVIRELAKLTGQALRLTYFDEGWDFGGEYLVEADGSEQDNFYNDPKDCPEELWEELDVQYYLDCMAENEDEE